MTPLSRNFAFLSKQDNLLARLGTQAENYFKDDPNTCLIKLRQFGEVLAQLTAAKAGLLVSHEEPQADLIRRLKFERIIPREADELFYQLRRAGNNAAHAISGSHDEALSSLKMARQLGIWFYRTFVSTELSPGPFIPPADPEAATNTLHEELARLRKVLEATMSDAEKAKSAAQVAAQQRMSAEELAHKESQERAVWEQLASEAEQGKAILLAELKAIQAASAQAAPKTIAAIVAKAEAAAVEIDLDEASTRTLIDAQLRARGWETDTPNLRYSNGSRPAKGRNLAIAEWPTKSGPADYALFTGTHCIAVVEAKRRNKNISSHIDQAQRYARGFTFNGGAEPIAGPWADHDGKKFLVPFVFSANGRAHLKQIETESGIWFRDIRNGTNHRRVLSDWPTPDGLKGMLEIDVESAEADLRRGPSTSGFPFVGIKNSPLEKSRKDLQWAVVT